MSTATTTSHDTGQHTTSRTTTQPTNNPTNQLERSAAQRLRTTMAAVRLSFTWLGARRTFAPEQRSTADRTFHADRELLSASKLILDNRAVAAVSSEASSYWRAVSDESAARPPKSSWQSMLAVMPGASTTRPWICGRSGSCRSPGQATWNQTPRAIGGLTWGLLMDRCWGPSGTGRRRWGRSGSG